MKKSFKKEWIIVLGIVLTIIIGYNVVVATLHLTGTNCNNIEYPAQSLEKCRLNPDPGDNTVTFRPPGESWDYTVTNTGAAGAPSYLIPLKSSAEWTAFYSNRPPGIDIEDSCRNGITPGATTGTPDCNGNCCKFTGAVCPYGWVGNGWTTTSSGIGCAETCHMPDQVEGVMNAACQSLEVANRYPTRSTCMTGRHDFAPGINPETCTCGMWNCKDGICVPAAILIRTAYATVAEVGCVPRTTNWCGDGFCGGLLSSGENCKNCLPDCRCASNEDCISKVCVPDPCYGVECGLVAGGVDCGPCADSDYACSVNTCYLQACLQYDTLVLMSDGTDKVIQDIEIGDTIKGLDINTGKIVDTRVTDTLKEHPRNNYYTINNELSITNDHPVAVLKNDKLVWTRVDKLQIGDKIKSVAGIIEISSIEFIDTPTITANLYTELGNFIVKGRDNGIYVVKSEY